MSGRWKQTSRREQPARRAASGKAFKKLSNTNGILIPCTKLNAIHENQLKG